MIIAFSFEHSSPLISHKLIKHMKNVKIASSLFTMGAGAVVLLLSSCNSNKDYKTTPDSVATTVSTDTSMKPMMDTSKMTDASKTVTTATPPTSSSKMGSAKGNPAKKHGKGRVILMSDTRRDADYANMQIQMDAQGIYNRTEVRPTFPGGQTALAKFIQDHIVYPDQAIDEGVEADVEVTFAVDENGKVYTPIIKGPRTGYGLDEAATDVVSKMPRWNPGQIKGKNVKSYYNLPISFKIQ
jgi:protein TonB